MTEVTAFALLLFVLGCGGDDDGDGGASIPDAPLVDAPPDADTYRCEPEGLCSTGVMCGGACCQAGERCVNDTCMCGDNPACGAGDSCVTGGPVLPTHGCGIFCCGASTGGCPI